MKNWIYFATASLVLAILWQSGHESINSECHFYAFCATNFANFSSSLVKQYSKMPALYEFESFVNCSRPAGQFENLIFDYCVVSLEIDESKSSKRAFNVIKKFSQNSKKSFRHDQLKRGMCLSPCLEMNEKLKAELNKYLNDDSTSSIYSGNSDRLKVFMSSVNRLLNVCINKNLNDTFGLMAKTSLDFCIDRSKPTPMDMVDHSFVASVTVIFFLIVIASIYGRFKHRPCVIYVFSRLHRTKRVIESFSVRQNWRKLLESDSSDLDCLTRFHASKFVLMFLFVFAQVYKSIASMPFANPIYVEQVGK